MPKSPLFFVFLNHCFNDVGLQIFLILLQLFYCAYFPPTIRQFILRDFVSLPARSALVDETHCNRKLSLKVDVWSKAGWGDDRGLCAAFPVLNYERSAVSGNQWTIWTDRCLWQLKRVIEIGSLKRQINIIPRNWPSLYLPFCSFLNAQ